VSSCSGESANCYTLLYFTFSLSHRSPNFIEGVNSPKFGTTVRDLSRLLFEMKQYTRSPRSRSR